MNTNYIKKLIRLVEDSQVESLEVSSWGRKVKITHRLAESENGHGKATAMVQTVAPAPVAAPAPAPAPAPQAAAAPAPAAPAEDTSKYVEITAPLVGTFYAAPAPDADPYVSLNERVAVGQVVCIVEAMKLMNEIESEVNGRIVKVMVENSQPVEFGQVLYLVEPS